jgi:SAM-dependent methyltransferase
MVNPSSIINRNILAEQFIKGEGLEIGALHSPLQLPARAKVKYVDRMSVSSLRMQYPELCDSKLVEPDVIDDGERLDSILDHSQDFVIANHFLEHCQNPILAISNMLRVLRVDGILFLAIPDKRHTFDIDRPVTTIEHLYRDYKEDPAWSKNQHYEEWVRLVDKVPEGLDMKRRISDLMEMDYSIHFHVWTQHEILELLSFLHNDLKFNFEIELFCKISNECILILNKS